MSERRRVGFADPDPAEGDGAPAATAAAAASTLLIVPPASAAVVSPRTPKGILKHGSGERKKFVFFGLFGVVACVC